MDINEENEGNISYPSIKREAKNISFDHGGQIVDNYNWLESISSARVQDFELRQNELTHDYLKQCPHTHQLQSHLESKRNLRKMSCPIENSETGKLFFFMKEENEEFDCIYVQTGLKGSPKLFISPKQILTSVSSQTPSKSDCLLRMFTVSPNGKVVAYAYSLRNSNWLYIRFKGVDNGKDFPEVLKNVCFSDISWNNDQNRTEIHGIVYSCCLNPYEPFEHKIAFHVLGTDQKKDLIFVEFPKNSGMTLQAQISDCGDMIFVTAQEDVETKVYTHFFYGDLGPTIKNNYDVSPLLFHLLEGLNLDIQYITNYNCITYFRTNLRAPNFRIVKTNLLHNDVLTKGLWETIVPNDPSQLLEWHYLMVCYVKEARHSLQLHKLENGQLLHIYPLPIGTIVEYFGFRHCSIFYCLFSSFLIPDCIHYIKIPSSETCCQILTARTYKKIKTLNASLQTCFNELSSYYVEQCFCTNPKDGAAVPMFLIHKKRFKRNGHSPCIMYGQGCFGVQAMPSFSIAKLSFLKCFDGIVVVVGVRGGGEYGLKWYRAGNKMNKQTSYDDFIAASEYLIKLKYTSASRLVIEGQLFGGNLVAACLTLRPDLYAAVIIHDGLLDLMRCHCFPVSKPYIDEFGDPEAPIYFEHLSKLCPVTQILNENTVLTMPAVLVLIGNQPSLAHPSNSFKFIAELQHSLASKSSSRNPFLLCSKGYDKDSGEVHGQLMKIDERALIFSFLIQTIGLKYKNDVKRHKSLKEAFTFSYKSKTKSASSI